MDLNEIRGEIDKIDDELVRLFCQRMHASAKEFLYLHFTL